MELTAIAQWLNTAFAGYDYAILQALHNLAGTSGGVFTPLCRAITLLGEKGILFLVLGIVLMLVLNIKYKMNSMIALLLAALLVGVLAGMDLTMLLHTIKVGFGSTLGELAIIVVFGAVIGKLMVDSGAAHRIAQTLLSHFGLKYVQYAVIVIGLIFGLAMFYEVAFIIMAPLIITAAEIPRKDAADM